MSNVWIQFIVFAVALLFFCWLLLEYWFYRKGKSPEGGLYLASKAAFALSHFWKAVDGAKEIPEDTLKKEAGRTPLEAETREADLCTCGRSMEENPVHWDRENGFGLRCRR